MTNFLLSWLVSGIVLLGASYVVPGFTVTTFTAALIAAIVIGAFNGLVRPILLLLTLPLNVLTLGLFTFVINAIGIMVASNLVSGFTVASFGTALIAAIVIAIVNTLVGLFGADSFA